MKGPTKKDDAKNKEPKDKKLKAKCVLLHSWLNRNEQLTSTEEAKAACKTRKRKERQESISSLCQERKVIRSNSEERPHSRRVTEKENIIRRVSSSEDLHLRNAKNKKKNDASKENLTLENTTTVEECEHEKRRSHERFAKPLALKCRKNLKKPKGKKVKKHEDTLKIDVQIHQNVDVGERSPSPLKTPSSPSFDFSILHQQVDDSEPLPSCSNRIDDSSPSLSILPNRLLSSPRNSIIATHCIYLDPSAAAYNTVRKTINPIDHKVQKCTKQLNVLKKKIKKFEAEFQAKNGWKPTHMDKINDANIKKVYMDMTKLKKEYKLLLDCGTKSETVRNEGGEKSLPEIIADIELKLESKRELANRSAIIEEMTQDQLFDEKIAVQKALLHLENVYGRPVEKPDRDLVRPIYDRYRQLKRLICKGTLASSISNDLETIHEDETIHFVVDTAKSAETPTEKTSSLSSAIADSDPEVSVNENLHAMDQNDLRKLLKVTVEEKKILKRTIKEYEISIQQKTGKMVQKEDKLQIEQLYKNYKTVKSKVRLLDALIAKRN